jgi:hypothetical protein
MDFSAKTNGADSRTESRIIMTLLLEFHPCELFAGVLPRFCCHKTRARAREKLAASASRAAVCSEEAVAMMKSYARANLGAMRMLPKGYADTAKPRFPSRGCDTCRCCGAIG